MRATLDLASAQRQTQVDRAVEHATLGERATVVRARRCDGMNRVTSAHEHYCLTRDVTEKWNALDHRRCIHALREVWSAKWCLVSHWR